ncbi:hypothetical protein V1527DRAFT_462091, partial [Lipomyces starkeyi]
VTLTHDYPPMHKSWHRFSSRCLRIPRSPEELIKKCKTPYEEALGSSRAMPGHTMRKASKSYYYMRPHNDYAKEN